MAKPKEQDWMDENIIGYWIPGVKVYSGETKYFYVRFKNESDATDWILNNR